MYYVHHVHPASASSQSVYLANFLPSGPCLCRVLHTSLSFVALPNSNSSTSPSTSSNNTSAPLSEILSLPINARILRVIVIPSKGNDVDRLAVLTDHHQPRLIILRHRTQPLQSKFAADDQQTKIAWTPIETEAVLLLDEMGRAAAESGLNIELERGPGASFMFTHTHAGILKVVPLSDANHGATIDGEDDVMIEGSTKSVVAADLNKAFGVRLPHPHLICSTFLARRTATSPSTVALLSLSSVASRLPGLGMQCLPVLSFHSIDEANQELKPMGWGPPRRVPPAPSLTMTSPTSPKASRRKSSSQSQEMPGSFNASQESSNSSSTTTATSKPSSTTKYHGPAAMGFTRTPEQEQAHEEALAKATLTRAHVPLPFADALGAHQLLSLPMRAGGGVLLFCESCILHVAPPNTEEFGEKSSAMSPKASASSTASGKRRKSSSASINTAPTTIPKRPSGTSTTAIAQPSLSTSPTSTFISTSPRTIRSNENGKRRRSTASSQTQGILSSSVEEQQQTSPTASRRRSNSGMLSQMTRLLRLDLGKAVIVASATIVCEPSVDEDDGVQVDEDDRSKASLQVLFGTHSGLLYLLTISLKRLQDDEDQPWRPIEMTNTLLGSIPAPGGQGALTYLGENFVSVASTGGDSVLVHVEEGGITSGETKEEGDDDIIRMDEEDNDNPMTSPLYSLRVIHRWTNLAPIMDFTVDDGAGGDPSHAKSAQARIITCSGTGPTGSLRIVRNGVSLEDALSISEGQVRRIWSISNGSKQETRLIILGYHTYTRILSVQLDSGGGFEDVTDTFAQAGMDVSIPVLEATTISKNGLFAVVNQIGVSIWSIDQSHLVCHWKPAQQQVPSTTTPTAPTQVQHASISKAAANEHGQILIAMDTFVALLQVESNGSIALIRMEDMKSEISALNINPLQESKQASIAAIGLWSPWLVKLFSIVDWEEVTPLSLNSPQPSLIRSIVLHTFTSSGTPTSEPHLLLGLGDGTLNSYGLSLPTTDSLSKKIGILEKRSASMGSQPLHLRSFKTAINLWAIFINCDRPSVVFSYGKGLQYSSVRHREVNDVCQFTTSTATTAAATGEEEEEEEQIMMIFAKRDELVLSKMGQIQKLDVGTIELGNDNPISLTICSDHRALALVAHKFLPEGRQTAAIEGGKVILFDHEDFTLLDEYQLELEERPNCIESIKIHETNILVVGTGYQFPDRSETLSGRILLFTITNTGKGARKLTLMTSLNVEGNTYAVGQIGNYIAACVNAKVYTFEVEKEEDDDNKMIKGKVNSVNSMRLLQVSEWACAFTAITLRPVGTTKLVIGDALRSIVLLGVKEETGKLEELARDCDPYWTMAAEVLDEEEEVYLGCDIGFNLWTCTRLKWTENAKKQMQKNRSRNLETGMGDVGDPEDPIWSHIMQRDAAFHYGDLVNSMKSGALTTTNPTTTRNNNVTTTTASVEPKIVFGTAAGAIGVVAKVDQRVAKVLSQLELNLRETFEPVGQIPAEEWRMLRTDHRTQKSAGFIDGDFLNGSYQDLSADLRTRLLSRGPFHVEAESDEINSLIESLNRLS